MYTMIKEENISDLVNTPKLETVTPYDDRINRKRSHWASYTYF